MPTINEIFKIDKNHLFTDTIRKTLIVDFFSFIGASTIIYFIIGALINKHYIYVISMSTVLALVLFNLYLLHFRKKLVLSCHILTSLQLTLNIGLLFGFGTNSTVLLWAFLIPIISAFLIGRKGILHYASIQLIAIVLAFKTDWALFTYPEDMFERMIIVYIVVSFLIYSFEYVREKTWNAFLIADRQKSEYLEEVLMQKEEIQAQSELLEEKNKELALLSLVASETDNIVIIADAQGFFQYVNKKFEQVYGLNIDELIGSKKNVFDFLDKYEQMNIIFAHHQSVNFTRQSINADQMPFWTQVNVSPFIENNTVKNIIVLETDITQLKLYEQKISEQNEELRQQTEEIIAQKEELEAKNEIISAKNEAISMSLRYASTIQKIILPDLKLIEKYFPNYLIYLPKDIVSGDFYWYEQTEKYHFFAVVDCTGHGVPAGFLTILASRILTEILKIDKIYEPAEIIKALDVNFFNALSHSQHDMNEGMDIILVRLQKIAPDTYDICYCGAKRWLLYFDSQNQKIVRDDIFHATVAGKQRIQQCEQRNLQLKTNSILFLTSDGYTDQQNSQMKKIGSAQLAKIIEQNIYATFDQQYKILLEFFENWKSQMIQLDDVTLWAIKL